MFGRRNSGRRSWMAGWFDGLFQGAADAENKFKREDGPRPSSHGRGAGYLAGFKQGVLDARAVAVFRRAEAAKKERRSTSGASGTRHFEPRT